MLQLFVQMERQQYEVIKDKYYEYDTDIYQDIHNLKGDIYKFERSQEL